MQPEPPREARPPRRLDRISDDDYSEILHEVLGHHVPQEMLKKMRDTATKLTKDIHHLQKAKKSIDEAKQKPRMPPWAHLSES